MTDEKLQRKIEDGEPVNNLEGRTYRKIFDVLKKEPYQLPSSFADRVMLQLNEESSTLFKDYIWLSVGLLSFFVTAVASLTFIHYKFSWGLFSWGIFRFISGYPGLILLSVILIGVFQWLDKRLVRPASF